MMHHCVVCDKYFQGPYRTLTSNPSTTRFCSVECAIVHRNKFGGQIEYNHIPGFSAFNFYIFLVKNFPILYGFVVDPVTLYLYKQDRISLKPLLSFKLIGRDTKNIGTRITNALHECTTLETRPEYIIHMLDGRATLSLRYQLVEYIKKIESLKGHCVINMGPLFQSVSKNKDKLYAMVDGMKPLKDGW